MSITITETALASKGKEKRAVHVSITRTNGIPPKPETFTATFTDGDECSKYVAKRIKNVFGYIKDEDQD